MSSTDQNVTPTTPKNIIFRTLNKKKIIVSPHHGNGTPIAVPVTENQGGRAASRKQRDVLRRIATKVQSAVGVDACQADWTKYCLRRSLNRDEQSPLGELLHPINYDNICILMLRDAGAQRDSEALQNLPTSLLRRFMQELQAPERAQVQPDGSKANPRMVRALKYMHGLFDAMFGAEGTVSAYLRWKIHTQCMPHPFAGYMKLLARTAELTDEDVQPILDFADGKTGTLASQACLRVWDVDTKADCVGTMDVQAVCALLRAADVVVDAADVQGQHLIVLKGEKQTSEQVRQWFPANSEVKLYNKVVAPMTIPSGGLQKKVGDNTQLLFRLLSHKTVTGEEEHVATTRCFDDVRVQEHGWTRIEDSRKAKGARLDAFVGPAAFDQATRHGFLLHLRELIKPGLRSVSIADHFRALAEVPGHAVAIFDPSVERQRLAVRDAADLDARLEPSGIAPAPPTVPWGWVACKRWNSESGMSCGTFGRSKYPAQRGGSWRTLMEYLTFCTARPRIVGVVLNGPELRRHASFAQVTFVKLVRDPASTVPVPVKLVQVGPTQWNLTSGGNNAAVSWFERGFPSKFVEYQVKPTPNDDGRRRLRVSTVPGHPVVSYFRTDARRFLWQYHKRRYYQDVVQAPMHAAYQALTARFAHSTLFKGWSESRKRRRGGPDEEPEPPSEALVARRKDRAKRDFKRLRAAGVYPSRSEVLPVADLPRHVWMRIATFKPGRQPWVKVRLLQDDAQDDDRDAETADGGTWYGCPSAYSAKYKVGQWMYVNTDEEPKVRHPNSKKKVVVVQFQSKAPVRRRRQPRAPVRHAEAAVEPVEPARGAVGPLPVVHDDELAVQNIVSESLGL